MTSRERIKAAIDHREPDMIPLDLGGSESSGITGIAYNRLRDYLGLGRGETRIIDLYQQIVYVEDDVREILKVDTIPLLFEPDKWKESSLPDGSPCLIPDKWNPVTGDNGDRTVRNADGAVVARMPSEGFYFEPVYAPLADITGPDELGEFYHEITSFDLPSFFDEPFDRLEKRAADLCRGSNYCVIANVQLHLMAAGQILRGYENFMVDLMLNKRLAHAILEMLTEAYIRRCNDYLGRVGEYVQVVMLTDDLGTQAGPMLDPGLYREMIWPYQKRLFSFIKRKSKAAILFHSCGSVHRFIPSLIEAGVDALNPVQVSAEGMDSKKLKMQFGGDITFWGGGCDTQSILNRGTPDMIRDEVRRRIDDLAGGGGFVFTQVHNIQPDVQPENIMAMFEAFNEFR